jgi:phage terminase large subunit-like protein
MAGKKRKKADRSPGWRSRRAIKWIQDYLRIPEGKFVGEELEVAEFMREDLRAIYDNPAGTRRAIISRGRKNGKTIEAAMIVLLHLCGVEARRNSQLYSTALSRDQAALLFNLAVRMIRLSPELNASVVIRETQKTLTCPNLGTTYRALSAEATTAFGLSPAVVVHDEIGQVRGPRSPLYEAMETATGAQLEPLSICISTQAPSDGDLLSILIDDAQRGHDPKTVLRLHTAPEEMDPFSLEAIEAANPALHVFMNKDEVLAMAESAKRMPARQAEFENLVLNRRVEASNPFVSRPAWAACGGEVADLHNVPIYAGLDLSSVSDLTALVLMGRINNVWHVKPTFWLPEEGLAEKARRDHVPYDVWHEQGYLETTPGASVSYEYVAVHLRKLFGEYHIDKLAFDRWNFKHLKPWLLKAGFQEYEVERNFVEFGQGTQSMSPALRDLEQVIRDKQLAHGDHPVLAMCAA